MVSVFFVTYTWLTTKSSLSTDATSVVKTDGLTVLYTNGSDFNIGNLKPGEINTKTFTVKNNSTGALNYSIKWSYVENNYNNKKGLTYIISGNGDISKEIKCPSSSANIPILKNITIEKGASHIYTISIQYDKEAKRKATNSFKSKLDVVVNKDEVSSE